MREKDETFSNSLEFKALLDKENGKKVKALGSNNGGEYMSNGLKKIMCKRRHLTRVKNIPQPTVESGG